MWNFGCDHEWEVITERREQTSASKLILAGGQISEGCVGMLQDVYILVCQCKKCGKLDKTIVRIG